MSNTDTDTVLEVIQRVYGDATQTVLDREAATEIIAALRRAGWASLDEVAMLIEAAGGSITVPGAILTSTRKRAVVAQEDFASMGRRFTVSVSA